MQLQLFFKIRNKIMDKITIYLKKDQKVYFTSDLHFQHNNVIRFCKRPFTDSKDMEIKLIDNWNSIVSSEDIVFDLGDVVWFDGRHDCKKILDQLNGTHYIILGNHDKIKRFELCAPNKAIICETCTQVFIHDVNNHCQELMLSHFPLLTWPHIDNGVINLFGHIHSGPNSDPNGVDQNLNLHPHQMDVGVDAWDYKPISLDFINSVLKR